jgi:chorismate mutase
MIDAEITELRKKLREIDFELLSKINDRKILVEKIALSKKRNNLNALDQKAYQDNLNFWIDQLDMTRIDARSAQQIYTFFHELSVTWQK